MATRESFICLRDVTQFEQPRPHRWLGKVALCLFWALLMIGMSCASARAVDLAGWPSGSGPISAAEPGSAQAATDVLTTTLEEDVLGLDPANYSSSATDQVTAQIYDTLFVYRSGDAAPMPNLVESWTISTNGLTWTLNLRPGIKFQDGTNLDAAAVVYNVERWWDPAHPFHQGEFAAFGAYFQGFKGDAACVLTNVKAIGATQVVFIFKSLYSILPSILASPAFSIASPTAIKSGTLNSAPVGSGPYRLVQRLPGAQVRLQASPTYWGPKPFIGNLVFEVIPDPAARLAAIKQGAAHMGTFAANFAATIGPDPDIKIEWLTDFMVGYLGYNGDHAPLGNRSVREAIAYAINKQALVERYYAAGTQPATQLIPPNLWGNLPGLQDRAYDPVLAKSRLAYAGYPDGFKTTLAYRNVVRPYLPDPVHTAEAIRQDLLAIGIDATLTPLPSAEFLEKVDAGQLDLFLLGWGADYPHPANFLGSIVCSDSLAFGIMDKEYCDLLNVAAREPAFAGQLTAYQAASEGVFGFLTLLPLVNPRTPLVARANVARDPTTWYQSYRDIFFADAWTLTPTMGFTATLLSSSGVTTALEIAAGSVATDTVLVYSQILTDSVPGKSLFAFAGHAFALDAFVDSRQVPLTPTIPITVAIDYPASAVEGMDESTLALFYWNGAQWTASGITLIERDLVHHRLVVTLSHLSEYALFGRLPESSYIPAVRR